MLKPGWADEIDPELVGMSDGDQTRRRLGKPKQRDFRPQGSAAGHESCSRGGKAGAAVRAAKRRLIAK